MLARGSAPWVLLPLALAVVLFFVDRALVVPPLVVAALMAAFFRDPDRTPGEGIVAAADGKLTALTAEHAVTFLNVHNVHVIRAPYAGTVTRVERFSGGHLPAFSGQAKKNAGVAIELDTAWGPLEVRLIAGLVARRALSYVGEGQEIAKGERIGIIQFGSRVDVALPRGATPVAAVGERTRAGETTLAQGPAPKVRAQEASH